MGVPEARAGPAPLVAVLGPTGAGKSELALALAQRFEGEIVNCDSVQVYRGLDVGSAKLPAHLRAAIPHHLIDIIDVNEELTAGMYSRLATEIVSEVQQHGRLPIVTGGTGFYLRALLDGLPPAPQRDERIRSRLSDVAARRPAALHRFLRRYDPASAIRIHQNDRQKLVRAVEIVQLTGRPASQTLARGPIRGVATLKLLLEPNRAALYSRLNARTAEMFSAGILEETSQLLAAGSLGRIKPLEALGYKQAAKVLNREWTVEEAIRECQTRTRQYAKRQLTWFRRESDARRLHGFGTDPEIQKEAIELINSFLSSLTSSK